jgi:hypothetical protein
MACTVTPVSGLVNQGSVAGPSWLATAPEAITHGPLEVERGGVEHRLDRGLAGVVRRDATGYGT